MQSPKKGYKYPNVQDLVEIDKTIIPFSDMVMVMANSARHILTGAHGKLKRVIHKVVAMFGKVAKTQQEKIKQILHKKKLLNKSRRKKWNQRRNMASKPVFSQLHGLDVGVTNIVDDNHLSNLDGSPYRNDRLRWRNASKITCTNDAHAPFFVPLPEKRGEIFAHALIGPAWRICPMLSSMKNKGIPPRRRKQTYGIRKAPKK